MKLTGIPWKQPRQSKDFNRWDRKPRKPGLGTGRFVVTEVLGRAFTIILRNIVPFGLLAVLVTSPPYLIAFFIDPQLFVDAVGEDYSEVWQPIVFTVFDFLLINLVSAALIYGTLQELRGQSARLGDSFRKAVASIFPVIAVALAIAIAAGFGLSLFIIPGLLVMTVFWVAIPATVIEGRGVFDSLKRSVFLTGHYPWKTFEIVVAVFLIGFVTNYSADYFIPESVGLMGYLIIDLVLTDVTAVIGGVIAAVSYYQLQDAIEGANVQQIAAVFD